MKRVLLIGNGAREHALGEAFCRSPQGCELIVMGKALNPGLKALAHEYVLGNIMDFTALVALAERVRPDFCWVGPDDPIGAGAADALEAGGFRTVAPLKTLARLESSKSFTRDLVAKYGIVGNPLFRVFTSMDGMEDWIRKDLGEAYVVKADGLMGGKGVQVSGEHLKTVEEGLEFARACIEQFDRVVVEEKLEGEEFSLMSFVDGHTVRSMPAIQDHKRAFEGDTGPNTGGMGTYSDANGLLPFLQASDVEEAEAITRAVLAALKQETGLNYHGVMYGGFMVTRRGVRLIEYNARFGDPEAMNALPLLKTDFIEVCEAILEERLAELPVMFEALATVVKYVVPEGYPEKAVQGLIEIGDLPEGARLYYSSVNETERGLELTSSRAVALVGISRSLAEAERLAEAGVARVKGPVFHRGDIGTATLIQKRVDHMRALRG